MARSRLHRGARADALQPASDIPVRGIDRLTDLNEERHETVQQDIGKAETAAAQEVPAIGHLAVQPLDAVLRDRLQPGRGLWRGQNAALEEVVAFAEAITVGKRLADIQVDAARLHPAFGLFFRRRADQCGLWIPVLEVFADRGDLRKVAAIVEFERRCLAMRVALEMCVLAIFAGPHVNLLHRDGDALLCHEDAHYLRIGAD
jgi:hypothetical protein